MNEDSKKDTTKTEDHFSRVMFGSSRQSEEIQHQPLNSPTLDYNELMVNIDTLMESVRNLKPLFQNFLPVIKQFWKKG